MIRALAASASGRFCLLGLVLALLSLPQMSRAGCTGPVAQTAAPNPASHGDVVKVTGARFAEDLPCCDSGAEACEKDQAESNVVPYRDMTIGLKDSETGDEKIVARGIDAGMRGQFRSSFRIPVRVEPGVYRVRVNVPSHGTFGAGRLRVHP